MRVYLQERRIKELEESLTKCKKVQELVKGQTVFKDTLLFIIYLPLFTYQDIESKFGDLQHFTNALDQLSQQSFNLQNSQNAVLLILSSKSRIAHKMCQIRLSEHHNIVHVYH